MRRAIHQKNTWVKRCDNYIFGSGEENNILPAIKACNSDEYNDSFCKFKNTIQYAWKNNGEKYDWYIKLDDDSYVVMENLKAYLSKQDKNVPEYHGLLRMDPPRQGDTQFAQGGAGYVMSKEAVRLLVDKGLNSSEYCVQKNFPPDDVEVARCFKKLGLQFKNSLDTEEKEIFNEFSPSELASNFVGNITDSSNNKSQNTIFTAIDKISRYPISFHHIRNGDMYFLEYFFYKMNVVNNNTKIDKIYKKMYE